MVVYVLFLSPQAKRIIWIEKRECGMWRSVCSAQAETEPQGGMPRKAPLCCQTTARVLSAGQDIRSFGSPLNHGQEIYTWEMVKC